MSLYDDPRFIDKMKRAIKDACYRREGKMLELFERQTHLLNEGFDPMTVIFDMGSNDNEYDWQHEFTDLLQRVAKEVK